MPSIHWFTAAILVGGLTSPALGQTDPRSTSPLRDAIARETARLGAEANAPEVTARWSRVRSLPPGELIHVSLSGQPALQRSFLAADDTTLTVLSDSNPLLPEQTVRDLRRLAATNPKSLLILTKGGTLRLDRLLINSGGVFLDDTRIADVSSIVELHNRDEVSEILLAEWRAPKRFWRYLLGWPGLIGFSVGVGVSAHACETRKPCSASDRTVAISGAVGALGLALAAGHDDRRTPGGVVYRRHTNSTPIRSRYVPLLPEGVIRSTSTATVFPTRWTPVRARPIFRITAARTARRPSTTSITASS